jgi:hypothetical protein
MHATQSYTSPDALLTHAYDSAFGGYTTDADDQKLAEAKFTFLCTDDDVAPLVLRRAGSSPVTPLGE